MRSISEKRLGSSHRSLDLRNIFELIELQEVLLDSQLLIVEVKASDHSCHFSFVGPPAANSLFILKEDCHFQGLKDPGKNPSPRRNLNTRPSVFSSDSSSVFRAFDQINGGSWVQIQFGTRIFCESTFLLTFNVVVVVVVVSLKDSIFFFEKNIVFSTAVVR